MNQKIQIRKSLVVLLFLYQTVLSLLVSLLTFPINFKKEVISNNIGIISMVFGIVIGSYLFGRWKGRQFPELLNDFYIKKLSIYIAIINMVISSIFMIVLKILGWFEELGLIGTIICFIFADIVMFHFYYFGTSSWLRRGLSKFYLKS